MRVFVDTNVWYPVVLADLVLRSVEFGLFDLVWSEELLGEVERVLVEKKGLHPVKASLFGRQVQRSAPDGRAEPAAYLPLVAAMTGSDPDDHVHAAAARAGRADVVLTNDLDGFPAADVGPGCRVLRPAEFYLELAETFPVELARTVVEMSEHRRRPPMTPWQILDRLRAQGLTGFADTVADVLA